MRRAEDPIAVVGIGCRFPDSDNCFLEAEVREAMFRAQLAQQQPGQP